MRAPKFPEGPELSRAFGRESIEIDDLQARLEDLEQKIDAEPKRVFADEPWQDQTPPPPTEGSA